MATKMLPSAALTTKRTGTSRRSLEVPVTANPWSPKAVSMTPAAVNRTTTAPFAPGPVRGTALRKTPPPGSAATSTPAFRRSFGNAADPAVPKVGSTVPSAAYLVTAARDA